MSDGTGQSHDYCLDSTVLAEAEERESDSAVASRIRSEVISNLSREMRTPLNDVVGMLTLLLDTDLTEPQREFVQTAVTSSDALTKIVEDALDSSEFELGAIAPERVTFSVSDVIRDVANLFGPRAREKSLWLSVVLDAQLPAVMIGDPDRLRRVIANLVRYAVRFTSEGSIEISVRVIHRTATSAVLAFDVKDTGIGLCDDERQRLFTTFSQTDLTASRRHGNTTGLGLTIAQRLAGLMGGTLEVTSRAGQGTSFCLQVELSTTPVVSAEADVTESGGPGPSVPTGGHLLVVEDNEVNQRVLELFVKPMGFDCTLTANGIEALSELSRRNYDGILMDCHMPGMDGFEATRRIRAMEGPVARIPIIAITASTMAVERAKCLEVGMDDFVPKPVSRIVLGEALRRHVNSTSVV